jgi:RNA polymerase sigma-70 factor (ECF subfamily)
MAGAAPVPRRSGRLGRPVALRDRSSRPVRVGPGAPDRAACARLGLLLPRETEAAQPTEVWLDGLDEALAGLTQGEHDAIRLRVLGALEYDEVARELRTTPAAARVRVHRGLTKLRNRLTQRTEAAG